MRRVSAIGPRLCSPSMAEPSHRARNGVTHLHSFVFRLTRGRLGRRIRGAPVLVLETRGRKSGRVRSVPLLYLEDDGDWVVTASSGATPSTRRGT